MAITAFLSRSLGLLNRGPLWDMFLIPASSFQLQLLNRGSWASPSTGCCFLYGILSPTGLISNWSDVQLTDFLSSLGLYNRLTPTFLWASWIAFIQPIHGQGYKLIFLDRMHLLFTQVHFLFWLLGRGQYATLFFGFLVGLNLESSRCICACVNGCISNVFFLE